MKRKIFGALVTALLVIALVSAPVMALYAAIIQVIETNGVDYNELPIRVSVDNQYLADNGYMLSTGLDTRVTIGSAEIPHLVGDDKLLFVDDIDAYTTNNFSYTLGNSALDSMPVITGYQGYITTADDSSIELDNEFRILRGGYLNNEWSLRNNYFFKEDAFITYVSADNEITARILTTPWWADPTGFTDPDVAWSNEANAYDNAPATAATTTAAVPITSWSSFLQLDIAAIDIQDIRFMADYNAGQIDQVDLDIYDGSWHDVYQGVFDDDAGGTVYNTSVLNTVVDDVTEVRFRFYNSDGVNPNTPSLYEVDFGECRQAAVSTGALSGEWDMIIQSQDISYEADADVLHFNGSGEVDAAAIYDNEEDYWVSLWFKLDTDFDITDVNNMDIFGKENAVNDYLYLYLDQATGSLVWQHNLAGIVFTCTSVEVSWTAGIWYHVIASMYDDDAAQVDARLRINGGTAVTAVDAARTNTPNGGSVVMGNDTAGGVLGLIGEMSSVVMGNDELSVAEELALYNGSNPGDEGDFYKMDEGSGGAIISYGSNGNAGAADGVNTSWETSHVPVRDLFEIILNEVSVATYEMRGEAAPDNANNYVIGNVTYMDYLMWLIY